MRRFLRRGASLRRASTSAHVIASCCRPGTCLIRHHDVDRRMITTPTSAARRSPPLSAASAATFLMAERRRCGIAGPSDSTSDVGIRPAIMLAEHVQDGNPRPARSNPPNRLAAVVLRASLRLLRVPAARRSSTRSGATVAGTIGAAHARTHRLDPGAPHAMKVVTRHPHGRVMIMCFVNAAS